MFKLQLPVPVFAPIVALALFVAPCAIAQDQSPIEILDASRTAIQEITGFSAQFKMSGEGGAMFAETMPAMNGQLFFGHLDPFGPTIHIIGESRDQKAAPAVAVDAAVTTDRFLWVDHSTKTINEAPLAASSRGLPSALNLVLMSSITHQDPFANDANNAQEIEYIGVEDVNGEVCDVIAIKRAKPDPRAAKSGKDAYTDVKWYIGSEDKLPRKVDHITDAGLIKITLSFELLNLRIIEPAQNMIDIARPDGYEFKSRMPRDKPSTPDDQGDQPVLDDDQSSRPTTQSKPVEQEPRSKMAPSFAFTPNGGTLTNNTTQKDRVTVLYFWGSWCVPCKETSPMVSALTQEFASSPVDVFGLAIREADPAQTSKDFTRASYNHALVLDAQAAATSFKVRIYPTLVVIDQSGEIIYQHGIDRQTSSSALIDAARQAITSALEQS